MLKLILGTAGSGKTSMIMNEIRERTEAGEGGNFLIVPEQYSFEAERELCHLCGDGVSLYAEVLSFSRLAVRVAQEMGTDGRVPVDKGGRLLCLSLALGQIGSHLKLYSAAQYRAELLASLLGAVTELRTARVSAEELAKAALLAGPGLSDKLSDLSLCMDAYAAVLAQGRADPADALTRLAETLGGSSVGNGGHVYFDGFTDFTGAEAQVIRELIKKDAYVTVCLGCDDLYGDSEQFEPSRRAANMLARMAKDEGVKTEIISPASEAPKIAPLAFFDEALFRYTPEVRENEGTRIRVLCADSSRAECEGAAALCLRLVRETGCRWRDIAVAVRGFDAYSAPLEEAFRLYGVPLFTARRGSILQKPAPALISSAFEIISGGWEADDVISYLKTGLVRISPDDRDLIENYVTMWNLRGSMWTRAKPWTMHPGGFGLEFDDAARERLDKIDLLRRDIASPLALLSENGKKADTAAGQARVLADYLSAIRLPETLEERAAELESADHGLLAAEYSQLWDIIVRSLEQSAAILGDMPMTQEQFSKLFLRTLSQYDVSAIPVSADSVTAGDMDRMRRRHIRHLIVLGASDDTLPDVRSGDGILSADEREELAGLGVSLGGGVDALSRELSLIYNCVTLPSETLTISYSAFDGNGGQLRPSFLIRRAKQLFGLREEVLDLSETRLSAPGPAFLLAAASLSGAGGAGAKKARAYFSETWEGGQSLSALTERAKNRRGSLSGEAVRALYGETLRLSPSRVDSFSSCRFAYFLKFGLKLSENERAGFEAPELGSFMHYILENVAREVSSGAGFKNTPPAAVDALVDRYSDLYSKEVLGDFEDKSPRFVYLFKRLRPSVHRIASDIMRELSRSDFIPLDFELSFMGDGGLAPVHLSDGKNELYVHGIADRVDGYYRDGKLYLRVIDYKTGKKSFSLTDVWYGMGMQMLLYLFALERDGRERYGSEIVPAGVLYIPARDTLVPSDRDLSAEELSSAKAKALRRSGLILDDAEIIRAMEDSDAPEYLPVSLRRDGSVSTDSLAAPERFGELRAHVGRRLLELGADIKGGKIDASPYYRGETENACLYCPYGAVCRFDPNRDTVRYLARIKPQEFWNRLEGGK